MTKKLTYEELKQKVKKLENKALERDRLEEEVEKIFNLSLDMIGSGNLDGYFTKINSSFRSILGFTEEEFLEKPFILFVHAKDIEKTKEALSEAAKGKQTIYIENRYKCKDGSYKWIEWKVLSIVQENKFIAVGRDITERKQAGEALKKAYDELEQMVQERTKEIELKTKNLEEMNTAMEVLLEKRQKDKIEVEDSVLTNVKELIEPYFKKIKKTRLSEQQKTLLNIIESNIGEIISPFTRRISLKYLTLTPKEIQVVNLIKHGSTTKTIAQIMNISPRTVDTHRKNIRKKIGLEKMNENLRSYLLSSH